MRQLFFIIFLLHSSWVLSQHSLTISGRVVDKSLGIYVANPEIKILTSIGDEYNIIGDSSGLYSFTATIDYDTLTAIIIVSAENQMTLKEKLNLVLNSDSTIKIDLLMSPSEVCHDTFLPTPLFFELNSTTLIDTNQYSSLKKFFSDNNNEFLNDALKVKTGIVVYCVQGYNELEGTAKKRADFITKLFKSNSALSNKIETVIIEKKDYFYCTHCDGCFEYYKYGQGINLTKTLVDKYPQLDQLRQVVEIKWKGNRN